MREGIIAASGGWSRLNVVKFVAIEVRELCH
jgi:hypothetical protein